MQISRKCIADGVFLTTVKTDKFKFNRVFADFILPLEKEHASTNALFPSVLLRGSVNHPNLLSIQRALSSLYGADADSYVSTCGEAHVITFYLKLMKEKYAIDKSDITGGATSLLRELMREPITENGVFSGEYVESEKHKLIDDIAAQINDKDSFAQRRCIELMCANEAWGVSELGKAEDVEKITPSSLYERYKYTLSHARAEFWFIGDFEYAAAENFVRGIFSGVSRGNTPDFSTRIVRDVAAQRKITETQNINQGKLVLGYRAGKGGYDGDFYVLKVLNSIFGGTAQSKLFLNVREKLSLCYSCSSRLYNKGIIIVSAGIEPKNHDIALKEIEAQLDAVRNGEITEEELEEAKRQLKNSLISVEDSAEALHSYYLGNTIFGSSDSPCELIKKIESVTVTEIAEAARGIKLDTEYFLYGTEAGR